MEWTLVGFPSLKLAKDPSRTSSAHGSEVDLVAVSLLEIRQLASSFLLLALSIGVGGLRVSSLLYDVLILLSVHGKTKKYLRER